MGLALQDLGESVAADGGLNRILHIGDVDLVAGGGFAIDGDVEVGLAEHAEDSEIFDSVNLAHDPDNLVGLGFQNLQVGAVDFGGEFALNAADRLIHVVFNGLGESPQYAGNLVEFALHGGDEFFFILVEDGTPLFSGFEIDEEFGIEKAGVIGAVIGTADLAGALRNFGKRTEDDAGLVGDADAFVGAGAGGEGTADPESAFIKVRQELGADRAAESKVTRYRQGEHAHPDRDQAVVNRPAQAFAIALADKSHDRVFPFFRALGEGETGQNRRDHDGKDQGAEQAKTTVQAMGWKSLPSTRCRVKMGTKAVMVMTMA